MKIILTDFQVAVLAMMAVASEAVIQGYGLYNGYDGYEPYHHSIASPIVNKVAYGPLYNGYDSYGYGHHYDHDEYVSNLPLRN